MVVLELYPTFIICLIPKKNGSAQRWRGRANPNEGWFKEAMEISIQFLSRLYGKEFKRES